MGVASRNEKRAASSWWRPRRSPAAMGTPDVRTPAGRAGRAPGVSIRDDGRERARPAKLGAQSGEEAMERASDLATCSAAKQAEVNARSADGGPTRLRQPNRAGMSTE